MGELIYIYGECPASATVAQPPRWWHAGEASCCAETAVDLGTASLPRIKAMQELHFDFKISDCCRSHIFP